MSELGPPEGTPPGVRDLLIEVTLNPATADLILRRLDAHQFVLISSADLDDIARNGTARRIVDAYWPARESVSDGVWLSYHHDWSGFAIFDQEIDALRDAVENGRACSFVTFGASVRQSV